MSMHLNFERAACLALFPMADDVLRGIYFDVSNPACFSNVEALYNEAKKRIPDLSRSQTREWLAKQEAYTLHKPARWRFVRNPIVVNGIDVMWEIDLADLSMLKRHNNNYVYLLQVIDALSRYAWSVPIKSKAPEIVAKAFEKVLKDSNRKPVTVSSDAGREFVGKPFQDMLRKRGIYHFVPTSDMKCPIIERWNRTLKTRMWRYFTHNNTFRYLDVLQDLVKAYNNSKHRMIACTPNDVTAENAHRLVDRQHALRNAQMAPLFKFEIGDQVRLSKRKGTFEKGYESNWTREIFAIRQRYARPLPVYKVKDLNGEPVEGVFYETQLQKVVAPETYKIDKIMRWRKRRGHKQALVRWLGYGPEFDQWIDEADLVKV